MKCWFVRLPVLLLCFWLVPWETPAPLVYRAGEGWTWEPVGGGKWTRLRAKDQLEVAEKAFEQKDYRLALKAARRTVRTWPLSDYAPKAQYLVGRCFEERRMDYKAFKEYQNLIEKYPKSETYNEVLNRQFAIANRYLAGQWFKLLGYIPFFPSMERTVVMYEKLIKNGPYSEVAPQAQMNIGAAREKQRDYPQAVKAYEKAADIYHDQRSVEADAIYKAGLAYNKQARKAEYDQSIAAKAIGKFTDFIALFPNEPRVPEAQQIIAALKTEQARGALQIAQFYEKKRRWQSAMVYYNEVVVKDPNSSYATEAKQRMEVLKKRTEGPAADATPSTSTPAS
ncbi:MAG: outer membrane protein assembly factor BamD [Verrucomicrobiota bacterium]|jgi:outer membrane protein assembly factor BamD